MCIRDRLPTLLTWLTWLLVISGWLSLTKPLSIIAFSDGMTTILRVWIHKGSALKGIRCCNQSDIEPFFPGPRSDTFCTDLVCRNTTSVDFEIFMATRYCNVT